ncbi:MAG: adenosine kinase [Rhodospirillales bacterium]|nr:adenosine kinase [Rhodospirillales bacterium]
MVQPRFDVLGIGNAMVDVIAQTSDAFLAENNLLKGAMSLVDADTSQRLYDKSGPGMECSGGSAGNTVSCLASLGARAAFVGKVFDDQLGRVFAHDIRALGVHFETTPALSGPPTATCLVLVTADAERTMQTFLGACIGLGPDDIVEDEIAAAAVTYMEGYLWDPEDAKAAFLKAAGIAHGAGREVSLSLSDPFCVDRHRDEFRDLVSNHVDILFANEDEIMSLYQVASFDEALQAVRNECKIAALTRSEKGSVIIAGDDVHIVDAETVDRVVDTTGAGDAYAAGFLHGYTAGRDLATAARIGSICAAEVISHIGARAQVNLKHLVAEKLGA